jgi:hypothetical protein
MPLSDVRIRLSGCVVLAALLAAAVAGAAETRRARPTQTFAGAPLSVARAAEFARAARDVSAKGAGQPRSPGTAAKVSGKPGTDGAPPDPQHEAQASATNEIIEALGDGKYEGALDQFWKDLESIQTWETPTWREPDPRPPVHDTVRLSGVSRARAAVLISGRYSPPAEPRECRRWVGYTSSSSTVSDVGHWIGNAPFDGCDSEVAVFSDRAAADLIGTERRWSKHADELDYPVERATKVPSTVWIVHARTSFADEEERIREDFQAANQMLKDSICGVELELGQVHDRTRALADPAQNIGCAVETLLKPQVGFDPARMNVYVVNGLENEDRAGVACTKQSDNVIVLDHGRFPSSLLHEYGHWFDLWHTNPTDMPEVDVRNVMSDVKKDERNKLTAGQCYRVNFSQDSYLNKRGLRAGKTKRCAHRQDADDECPGLKNEF